MATPITWRTVTGPSLAEASRPLAYAQQAFAGAFDTLKGTLKESEAFDQALWKRQDQAATQDALSKIYQAQNVDQFNALNQSGVLDQATAPNGAVIDRAAVNALRDGRVGTLQDRAVREIGFKNTMLDAAQEADVRAINLMALQDPKRAQEMLAQRPDLREAVNLARTIDSRTQTLTERDRATTRFGFDTAEETRRTAEEAQRALLRPFAVKNAQNEQELFPDRKREAELRNQGLENTNNNADLVRQEIQARIRASNETSNAARLTAERADRDRVAAQEVKRLDLALQDNLYKGGLLTPDSLPDLAALTNTNKIGGKDGGDARSYLMERISNLAKNGITRTTIGQDGKPVSVNVPVPLSVVKAALLSSTDISLFGSKGYADSFDKQIESLLPKPTVAGPTKRIVGRGGLIETPQTQPLAVDPLIEEFQRYGAISTAKASTSTPEKKKKEVTDAPFAPSLNSGFSTSSKTKPVVADSTGFSLNPVNGSPVARTDPVELPKDVKWKQPVTAVKATAGAIPKGTGIKAVVSYVADGDTFSSENGINCRIDTIDAPETAKKQYGKAGQPFGEESKKRLEELILNKEVNIRIVRPDGKYAGRSICQVEIEGKGLDHAMVEQGAAWVYKAFAQQTLRNVDLNIAENTARKEKRGLWKDPNPVYPPAFRARQ